MIRPKLSQQKGASYLERLRQRRLPPQRGLFCGTCSHLTSALCRVAISFGRGAAQTSLWCPGIRFPPCILLHPGDPVTVQFGPIGSLFKSAVPFENQPEYFAFLSRLKSSVLCCA